MWNNSGTDDILHKIGLLGSPKEVALYHHFLAFP
jgi:hypothetical protein